MIIVVREVYCNMRTQKRGILTRTQNQKDLLQKQSKTKQKYMKNNCVFIQVKARVSMDIQ